MPRSLSRNTSASVQRPARTAKGVPEPRQQADFAPRTFDTDDLDIPTFVRKRLKQSQRR